MFIYYIKRGAALSTNIRETTLLFPYNVNKIINNETVWDKKY